jgi:hypothetical protein
MNEDNNRVTATFTGPQLTTFNTAVTDLETLTADLESLTPEERDALPRSTRPTSYLCRTPSTK